MFEKFFGNNPDKDPQKKDNNPPQNQEDMAINNEINRISESIRKSNEKYEQIGEEWSAEFKSTKDEIEIAENILTKIIEYYKSHYPNVEMGAPFEDFLEDAREEGSGFDEKTLEQIDTWVKKYSFEINKLGSLSYFIQTVSKRRNEDIALLDPGPEKNIKEIIDSAKKMMDEIVGYIYDHQDKNIESMSLSDFLKEIKEINSGFNPEMAKQINRWIEIHPELINEKMSVGNFLITVFNRVKEYEKTN